MLEYQYRSLTFPDTIDSNSVLLSTLGQILCVGIVEAALELLDIGAGLCGWCES